nr:U32 family peptidase [uncultured Butyricicoccus sp.]
MPELLAPAGSFEGVRAAVQSGANAVYMGFGTFNARRGAKNFSREEMAQAIAYCRTRGVKTNITFNIVALDRELEQAMQDVQFLYQAGADALIVQDLGLARLIREHAPQIELHASTQMTIHTLDGARAAKELGFSRVVLSRECTLDEIEKITREAGVETEVFVHGALCMCYSGQCYMSSVIGQRSGNRGLCAQPCRLPYTYADGKKGYPLSLKDLCAAKWIPTLTKMGVTSFKIEGRMKRPEYSAVVTKIYADLLREQRGPTKEENETLRKVFSRDGFTDGYLTGHVDEKMFGTKTDLPMQEVKPLYDEAARRFAEGKEAPLVPVEISCTVTPEGISVQACDMFGHGAQAADHEPVERANNRPTTREMLVKNLIKTGGTPFFVRDVERDVQIELPEGYMVPASRINALRRTALNTIEKLRGIPPKRNWIPYQNSHNRHANVALQGYTLEIRKLEQLTEEMQQKPPCMVYVPLTELDAHPQAVHDLCARDIPLAVQMPRIYTDTEQPEIERMLKTAWENGVRTACAMNLGQLPLLKRLGFVIHGGFGLNVCNGAALDALAALGVRRQTLSFELRTAQLRDVDKPIETELLVYGYLPLMVFENCAIRRRTGQCTCQKGITTLTDRKGQTFGLLPEFGCRNTLLNSKPLYLADKDDWKQVGAPFGRICLTTESPERAQAVWRAYTEQMPLEFCDGFTRGLYQRGVE